MIAIAEILMISMVILLIIAPIIFLYYLIKKAVKKNE
jgi:ABC-type transport system involved in cytochrome bd biosynthesis fused ATPase/permease subunit